MPISPIAVKAFESYKKTKSYRFDKYAYNAIIQEFLKFMAERIAEDGIAYLPNKMGQIEVFGFKPKKRKTVNGDPIYPVDWKSTNELWRNDEEARKRKQLVYIFNEHTDGIRYKIAWNSKNYVIGVKEQYKFRPTNSLKKAVSKNIMEGKEYEIREK